MMEMLLAALLLLSSDAESAKRNEQALAQARAAVGEMVRIARTAEEKALAETDRALVERAAEMLLRRAAAKQTQEAEMTFNRQYLELKSQMQHENRSYTAISNIMKTKHDTVKNSISNIR